MSSGFFVTGGGSARSLEQASATTYYADVPARVEYVTTSDGVRIAYAKRGRGPIVVWMPPLPARHVELEWEQPGDCRWLEWLAGRYTLVQYDPRGLGLSDRSVTSFSLDDFERDIEAVVERVAVGPVVLFAKVNAGPLAIAYAVRHPERVSHLVLWCATTRLADGIGNHLEALRGLAEQDWELFLQTAAHLVRGWSAAESAAHAVSLLRASLSPEAIPALVRDAFPIDVTDQLPRVQSATLVCHRRDVTWVPMERAVELASSIPNARLTLLEGDSMSLWSRGMSDVIHAFEDFMGGAERDEVRQRPAGEAFRYEGDYWTLAFAGRLCRLRDAKGLHHIAHLLARPGEYIPAADLLMALDRGGVAVSGGSTNGTMAAPAGDAGPLLDGHAKNAYRRRVSELRVLFDDAERSNDALRAAAVRTEMEFVEYQLAAAVGRWGRDRRASSAAERARLTVTKRIKGVLERIASRHPPLAEHLGRTIRTGLLCAYIPDSDRTTHWSL